MSEFQLDKIGKGNASESFIDSGIDIADIKNIIFNSYKEYKKPRNLDKFDEILFKELNNKTIPLNLNSHISEYIKNNKDDKNNIINYLRFRYKFYIAGKNKINLGYPPYVLIEPASACNLKCPFCFQSDKTFSKIKKFMGVMKFDFFKKIIDECASIGVGAITMASRGEPTMNKKLDQMITYAANKKKFFEIKINTNGTFLTEKLCHSIFKNNLTNIVISADHYIKEDFERLRLGSNFEKVVKNVDMLFNIRKKFYPNSNTEIRISGIDNEKNLNMKNFKDFWIKRSDNVSAGFPIERWNTYTNNIHTKLKSPCENLWDRMYIWYDGKVNPCDSDYKSYLSYGNLNDNSIKEVWNNKINEDLRHKHLKLERIYVNPCDRCGICHE